MVFSFFSRKGKSANRRKPSDASPPPETAAAESPRVRGDSLDAHREAARITAEKIDRIESEMIADGGVRASPGAVVPPEGVPVAVVAPPSRPVTDLMQDTSSLALGGPPSNAMTVDINASPLPGVLEEAAILYANGQSEAAGAALQQALAEADLGGYQQLGWLMLLDLHQLTGDKAAFESLALDYAARFESSPPAWTEPDGAAAAARAGGGSILALPNQLDEAVSARIDVIERGMERRRETILDCASLQFVDSAGAARLMSLFTRAGRLPESQHRLVVRSPRKLFDVARAAIEPGRRDDSDACWMLSLYALRLLDEEQAFEDLGIEFCVTYEVSPPSWEPLPPGIRAVGAQPGAAGQGAATAADADRLLASPPAEPNAFVLAGEVTGRAASELRALKAFATGRSDVVVDCRNLRRLEFLAVGELLNEVINLRSAGKQVLFAEPNRLVFALMQVMGLQELAEIRKRRI